MKMKNKKEEQKKAKDAHRKRLLEQKRKKRATSGIIQRSKDLEQRTPAILIVTEGQKTEPCYFEELIRHFEIRMTEVKIEVEGTGRNGLSLVNKAIELAGKKYKDKAFNQIWCVFDADPKPDNPSQLVNFDNAIKKVEGKALKKKGFRVAFSHQAFEYWLILHFNAHQGGKMDRKSYNKIINDELKKYDLSYDGKGSKEVSRKFFEWLIATPDGETQSRMDTAIERAKKIHDTHKKNGTPPSQWESCTTVYELVEELLKYKEH